MRSLLDINVLIALLDEDHAFHHRAHAWWAAETPSWASCPLTENGVVRILSSASYSKVTHYTVSSVVFQLRTFTSNTDHAFWEDSLSLLDATRFEHDNILSSKSLTDIYLLALAATNGGRLVTFDQGISLSAVSNAQPTNLLTL